MFRGIVQTTLAESMFVRLTIVILVLITIMADGRAQSPSVPPVNAGVKTLTAVRAHSPKIDGLMEAEWLKAAPADRFIQRRPVEGAAESLPTRVFVLYDDDAVNFCFVCNDDPDSIQARVLRRDNADNSDLVAVYLDSFHDHRNCYYVAVTAAGVQIDGVMSNETVQDDTWDAVWESAVGRTDSGWVAELRVPFASFRHGGAREDGWGLNLVRLINRNNEAAFWQPVNDQRGLRVGEFGTLRGLENIGSSRHLEILPHAVGRWDAPADNDWKSENEWENLGAYLKYVPAASWTMDLAYQPDFAQVDVDEEVINTSDYPVFLTEKRPFFLEVNNFFDTAPITLLYPRRITDPDVVGRVYGVSEKFRGMILAGQNRTADGYGQAVGAGRALWNIGKRSSLGVTSAGMYQDYSSFHAVTGGVDGRIRWGELNRWAVSAAGVDRTAWYLERTAFDATKRWYNSDPFEFRNGLLLDLGPLLFTLDNQYRGQDYNINDLGWGNFSNAFENFAWLGNNWQSGGWIQWWGLDFNFWQRTLADGRFPEGGFQFNSYFKTQGNIEFGGGTDWGESIRRKYTFMQDEGEFRDNFFEYYGRFDMDPHPYHSQWLWFESDERRWLSYATEGNYGTFREGGKWILNQRLDVRPRANLETGLAVDWERVWGVADFDSSYGAVDARIWRWQTRYSPTLKLSLRGTLQWIDEGHPDITGYPSNTLLTNLLLAWNWHPGSWFYIVYDEGRKTNPLAYNTEWDRTVRAKVTYFFAVK